jgi:RNA-binding protein YlmH
LEPCSHGDFLGAILGTGITREKVGDILLQVHYIPSYLFANDLTIPIL